MFIGHYGPAGFGATRRLRLWHAVFAVQFLDILWAPFVILGVEHVRIAPGFTDANSLDLYHMPYSHSLPMAIFWSLIAGLAYRRLQGPERLTDAIVFAALVFSHWVLDFITHIPDLPLWIGGPEVGLGLWEHGSWAFAAEVLFFCLGMLVFALRSRARSVFGWVAIATMVLVALALQVFGHWGPPPASPQMAAFSALIAYSIFIGLAYWVDRTRKIPMGS